MPERVSKAAMAYVTTQRQGDWDRYPNWPDVAAAYDAGMKHGVEANRSARAQVAALHDKSGCRHYSDGFHREGYPNGHCVCGWIPPDSAEGSR